jgi:hypothetical protein
VGETSLRRWLRLFGAGVLVVGAVLFVLVLGEPVDARPTGDAVVVHAGGTGERLDRALELIDDGAAPVLVVMYGDHPDFPQAPGLCGAEEPFEVICPSPEPVSTVGEARALGTLIDDQGWDEVVIVTSDYHVRRAKLLDARCTDATIRAAAAAPSSVNPWEMTLKVGHEMAGLVQAALFTC